MRMVALCAALLSTASLQANPVAADSERYRGTAVRQDSGQLFYTETHVGSGQHVEVQYRDARGQLIASRRAQFGEGFVAESDYRNARNGAELIIRNQGAYLELRDKAAANVGWRTRRIPRPADAVADLGLDRWIQANWSALAAGRRLNLSLLAPSRASFFSFQMRKTESVQFRGRPAIALRLTPDSMLRFLVGPIELLYDTETRRMLRYRGPSEIEDADSATPNISVVFDY